MFVKSVWKVNTNISLVLLPVWIVYQESTKLNDLKPSARIAKLAELLRPKLETALVKAAEKVNINHQMAPHPV